MKIINNLFQYFNSFSSLLFQASPIPAVTGKCTKIMQATLTLSGPIVNLLTFGF
jgi:hypothetical protein